MNCNFNWNCKAGSFPYRIQKGDTLYALAKRYKTTVERLLEVNPGIDPLNLQIDSQICIPQPFEKYPTCMTTNYYVVKENDTIYSIAKYFGVTVKQILYSNMGIEPENIYEGMILCIPIAPPPLCIELCENVIKLKYVNGEEESFRCINPNSNLSSAVVQKELDSSTGGKKRLNLLIPNVSIASEDAKKNQKDIILSNENMDYIFNKTPVGTGVVSC